MPVIFTEEKRKELEQDIKNTALDMFEKNGIKNTTVAEIAQSVGIAKGTFYNFFSSKGSLVCSIADDFDQRAYAKIYERLGTEKKMPAEEFYKIYSSLFTPENSFICHIGANDIDWMKNDADAKKIFESERAIETARFVLGFIGDVRDDIDLSYVANTVKTVNLIIENRSLFCEASVEKNISFLLEHLLRYITGKENIDR